MKLIRQQRKYAALLKTAKVNYENPKLETKGYENPFLKLKVLREIMQKSSSTITEAKKKNRENM